MTPADTNHPSSLFDRSFLPDAQLEFVVLADTHYIHNPHIYKGGPPQDPPYRLALTWSARADHAWRLADSLESAFIVHLGDLTQEFPGRGEDFDKARQEARDQFMGMDPQPHVVVGNMDIGDKQDATVLSGMVTPTTLADWHNQFGRSWYSPQPGRRPLRVRKLADYGRRTPGGGRAKAVARIGPRRASRRADLRLSARSTLLRRGG